MGKLSDAPATGTASNAVSKAPTSEQLRIAQLLVDPKSEDHSITKDKVNKVMELTRCNESTALVALHDCDNDVEQAVDKLLEGGDQDEWIVQEGKKSKKVQQQQPPHYQTSYRYHEQQGYKENHHDGENDHAGKNFDNFEDENSTSAPFHGRGPSRGGGHVGGDFPPRFRGRGGSGIRNPRRFEKENEPFDYGGADRGRGRGRGRGGREFGGERGRGRGFATRGGRRGGGFGNRDGGFDQQMGSWNSAEVESNTWDNSMANSCNTRNNGGSGTRRTDEWKGAEESNTWDNSMAQTAAPVKAKSQQRSNEWNNNSADDWGGEEDWSKGLVIESSGVHKQHGGSAPAPVPTSSHTNASSSYASVSANAGHVRGESIDVNMLFTNQLPETQSSNSSQGIWTSKQATADLKNELGIGKVAPSTLGNAGGHLRQRDPLPAKQNAAKVELPSMGNRNAIGPIDVQFGDMTLLSDSQPLFAFDPPFKSQTSVASSQPKESSLRQGQVDASAGVFQRAQKNEHINGPDLLLGSGDGKVVDVTPTYSISSGYATATQAQKEQQFGSTGTAIRQMATGTSIKNSNSGLSGLTSSHQRALLSGNNSGANVPVQVPMNDTTAQLSKDLNLNQSGISLNVGSSAHGATNAPNYGLSSAQASSRSPASIVTTRPQASSSLNVNPNLNANPSYQQAIAAAGLSPYLNMYDQMSLNSVGMFPPQNLFLNAAGGFDLRALTQLPPLAGNNVATGRDNAGDLKTSFVRQDTGSNLAATASGLANLSVPPPGLPAPTVSNAEQAAQILSMAGMAASMYPPLPFINAAAAPQFLAPQFLVPNVSSTSTGTTGNQYQRTSGFPQAPMFNAAGYEEIQLPSQDFGKSNSYSALSSNNQTKTVSSGASGMALGVNDGNKAYAGGLKGYDTKQFVPATATPPPLGNMNFPFQTTAATGAPYGFTNYLPPVNMNMMASPMAAALASNIQLSSDLLGTGAMNQRGGGQNSKTGASNMAKPTGQYPFPSWGN